MSNIGFRKEEKGKATKDAKLFSYHDALNNKLCKVSGIKVWYDRDCIAGFLAFYKDNDGAVLRGNMNVSVQGAVKCQNEDVQFEEGDYLKKISGMMDRSESCVQSLTLVSANGRVVNIGKPSNSGKLFRFDINEYEYPTTLFGALANGVW